MIHRTDAEVRPARFGGSPPACEGADATRTGMAKTVGLTTGIGAKLILEGVISNRGVQIPTSPEVSGPILAELRDHDIHFDDRVEVIG